MRLFIILLFCLISTHTSYAETIRTIKVKPDQIITLNTKIGFSTKIIFEKRPKPGLVGDQDAFSVEYLNKVVSIKPLIEGSTTNLFIPSTGGNYSFILKTGNKLHDDVVYIKDHKTSLQKLGQNGLQTLPYKKITKTKSCNKISIQLSKISWPKSGSSWIFDYKVKIQSSKLISLYLQENETYNFLITQNNKPILIEGSYQDRFLLDGRNYTAIGKIHIRQGNINPNTPLTFIYRPKTIKSKDKKCLPITIDLSPLNKLIYRRS